ncbi:MAG: insulinase family protein [Deltaproteobacteria bacterium]|nr:insulinase family protein [Deltaproteobacteria bacterium]
MSSQFSTTPAVWGGAEDSYVLDNGLKVILAPQPGNPVISARVVIKAGSANENGLKEYGLAHLMEHMAFKGTAKRKVGEISSLVETSGGSINAYTSYDETCYHLSLPAEEAELALDILADLVFAPTYDPKEYASEKEVVVEEIKRSMDSPDRVMAEEFMERVFKDHPYGHMVLGSADTVRGVSRETALAFHRKHYRPDNAFLVVSGGLDPSAVRGLVDKYFKSLKKPAVSLPTPPANTAAENKGPVLSVMPSEQAAFPKVLIGFRTPGGSDSRSNQLDMISAILSQGRASRLYSQVRVAKGLVTDIDTYAMTPKLDGCFYIGFETEPGKIQPALAAIIEELEGLVKNPPTDEEMARARALTGKSFLLSQESAEGQNGIISSFELQTGEWRLKDAYISRWSRLIPADLVHLAREFFTPENMTVTIMLPREAAQPDRDQLEKSLKQWSLPEPKGAGEAKDNYETYRLDNGVEVLLLRDASLPQVIVKVLTVGGLLGEGEGQDGLSHILAEVWPKASRKLPSAEMARTIENLGASIEGFSARNSLGLSGSFLSSNWAQSLKLMLDLVTEPALAQENLEEVREETVAALKLQEEQMAERAFRLVRNGLFREHPYHRNNLGLLPAVEKFTREDLQKFYGELIRPEKLLVAVAGDIDPQAVLDLLKLELGSWRPAGSPKAVVIPEPPAPLTGTSFGSDNLDRAQTHLILGFLAAGLDDPDQAPLEVLSAHLSGMGGILFTRLRDQQSLAYVVSSGYNPGLLVGTFYFYIATDPQKTGQATAGILDIIDETKANVISGEELAGAKRYLVGIKKITRQTLSHRVDESVFNKLLGLGLDFDARYLKAIEAVTAADLQRVARKYLDLDRAFFGAAGQGEPTEKVWADVRARVKK